MKSLNILCVSHVAPWPATHGNEMRLQRLILWLRKQNYRVILVLTNQNIDPEQQELIRSHVDRLELSSPHHGLLQYRSRRDRIKRLLHDLWPTPRRQAKAHGGQMQDLANQLCPAHVNSLARRLAADESVDFYFAFYGLTLQAFLGLPAKTKLICDTIEVFSMQRHDEFGKVIEPVLSFSAPEERTMLLQSDYVIAIQQTEANYLRQLLPERKVLTIGIDSELPAEPGLPSNAAEVIGILGSDNEANREGLDCFLERSWPSIKAMRPEAELRIAGKLSLALQTQLRNNLPEGVTTRGWIANLEDFYRDVRLVVNPALRGTGLKIKTVEALAHSRPIIAYPVGLEGIDWPAHPPWCEVADADAMAEACIRLLEDASRCDAMAYAAKQFAVQTLSAEQVYAPLREVLNGST